MESVCFHSNLEPNPVSEAEDDRRAAVKQSI